MKDPKLSVEWKQLLGEQMQQLIMVLVTNNCIIQFLDVLSDS